MQRAGYRTSADERLSGIQKEREEKEFHIEAERKININESMPHDTSQGKKGNFCFHITASVVQTFLKTNVVLKDNGAWI